MKRVGLWMCVVALMVASCGSATEPSPPPADAPEATVEAVPSTAPAATSAETEAEVERTGVRFAVTDWEQPMYADLVAAFEEENPDLRIEFVSVNEILDLGPIGQIEVPDDAAQRLAEAADVADIGVSREVVDQGLVRDLTPFMDADPNFRADDFYAGTLESYQWEGATWALPTGVSYRLMFFDKDAFDEVGVPYPEAGWTWDDLLVAAKALTVSEGDDVSRWGFVPNAFEYRLIESRVGRFVDTSSDPSRPRFDESPVADAVRWHADLYRKEQVMPYFALEDGEDAPSVDPEQSLIDAGEAGMWPDHHISWWLREQAVNLGVVPFPEDTPGADASPASPSGMSMSAGTTVPEGSWRWMEFLSSHSLPPITMGIKLMPARRLATEAGGFWDGMNEELAGALRYAIDHGYPAGAAPGYDELEEALAAIMGGDSSVEDALAEAQTRAEAAVQDKVVAQAAATPVPTFVVAPAEEEDTTEGATSITFIPGLGSLNLEPYRDLAQQYQEANPGVVVEVKTADFMSGAPDLQAMASTSDCFEWYPGFQNPEDREAILGLEPFVDADPSFSTDDYFPQVLDQFTWQGQLMGLPADITPLVIEYNKDLFTAAGLEPPAPGWTWDDFLSLAVSLTQGEDEGKQYGFAAEAYELNDLLLITERLGAKLADADADPPAYTFDHPDTADAFRWYAGLVTEHGAKPVFITDLMDIMSAGTAVMEREAMVNDGRAAMWTGSPAAAVLGDRTGLDVGVAPLPVPVDGKSSGSILVTSGYFVSAETEEREACWKWITYLSQQPGGTTNMPARRSVAESDEYRQTVGAERADAYLASVGSGDIPSSFQLFSEEEWMGIAIFWLGQAFGQIVAGEASVEDALDGAQALAEDYRACVIAKDDTSEAAWQSCAKEVDPELPDFLLGSP